MSTHTNIACLKLTKLKLTLLLVGSISMVGHFFLTPNYFIIKRFGFNSTFSANQWYKKRVYNLPSSFGAPLPRRNKVTSNLEPRLEQVGHPQFEDIYFEDSEIIDFHRQNWDRNNNDSFCQEWRLDRPNWTAIMTGKLSKNATKGCPNPYKTSLVKRIVFANSSQGMLGCTAKTPRCKETAGFVRERNMRINLPPCCRKHLLDIYEDIVTVLREMNVTHFMIGGAVIGWMRNKKIIPYDEDLDLLVPMSFWKTNGLQEFMNSLRKNHKRKCKLVESTKMKVYYSDKNDINVDIWPYVKVRKRKTRTVLGGKTKREAMLLATGSRDHSNGESSDTYIEIPYYGFKRQPISNLLPPRQEIFEHLFTFLPNNPKAYLDRQYGKGKWEKEYTCKTLGSNNECTS